MKFYFCEKCGQRLTENDIKRGEARDKKLRGVMCSGCAEGVMTLETMPMDEENARKILQHDSTSGAAAATPASPTAPVVRSARRTTGAQRVIPPVDQPRPSDSGLRAGRFKNPATPAAPATRSTVPLAIAGLVVLTVSVLAAVLLSVGAPRESARPRDTLVVETLSPSPAPHATIPDPVRTLPAPESPAPEEAPAEAPEAPAPEQPVEVNEAPPPPLEPPPPSGTPPTAAPEVPKPETPAAEPAGPAPLAPDLRAETWPWHELLTALQTENHGRAQAWLDARPADAPGLDDLRLYFEAREARQVAIAAALQGRVGQPIDLPTATGRVKGTLVEFKEGTLTVERPMIVNGETRGQFRTAVALDRVSAEAREGFAAPIALPGDAGRISRALEAFADKDLDAAGKALEDFPAHPLHAALAELLKKARAERLEEEARTEWERLRAEAEKAQTIAAADKLSAELKAWDARFGSTAFAKDYMRPEERAALNERLSVAGIANDPRLLGLFRGRVVKFDRQTLEITLLYDFQEQRQCEDFLGTWHDGSDQTGAHWRKGSIKLLGKAVFSRVLCLPFLRSQTFSLAMDFKELKASWGNKFIGIGCFGQVTDGKGPAHVLAFGKEGWAVQGLDNRPIHKGSSTPPPESGRLEVDCRGGQYRIKCNGQTMLEKADQPSEQVGITLISGWDTYITITALQVTGRLDPAWVKQALNPPKPAVPSPASK
ncbi:MAG: hypothetical protein HS116_13510 [Planctomycetes bacterium]|nr:hypothetical protein [Planctomycetota bacterium]